MGSPAGLLIATELGVAADGPAAAAALAVALAGRGDAGGALLVELGATSRRRPTLLSSAPARALEDLLASAGFAGAAARGRLCWVGIPIEEGWCERLAELAATVGEDDAVIAHAPAPAWREALDRSSLAVAGALIRADVRAHRPLLALCVAELRDRAIPARVATRPLGLVGARRALAGLDPGGPAAARFARAARVLARRGTPAGASSIPVGSA